MKQLRVTNTCLLGESDFPLSVIKLDLHCFFNLRQKLLMCYSYKQNIFKIRPQPKWYLPIIQTVVFFFSFHSKRLDLRALPSFNPLSSQPRSGCSSSFLSKISYRCNCPQFLLHNTSRLFSSKLKNLSQ